MDIERLCGGDAENIVEKIMELADDIDQALVPEGRKFAVVTGEGTRVVADVGIILRLLDGTALTVGTRAAETVLNDGVLNRLRITIKFADGVITNTIETAAPASSPNEPTGAACEPS